MAAPLLVLGCAGEDAPRTEGTPTAAPPPSTPAAAPAPPAVTPSSGTPTPTPRAAVPSPAATAYGRGVVPPDGPAGAEASANVAPGARRVLVNVSFRAVNLGRLGDRFVVVYPQVYLTAGGGESSLHVKLPLLSCDRRAGDREPDFYGCRDRRVEYGDVLGEPGAVSYDGRRVVVDAEVATYAYAGGGDRGAGLTPRWTGRAYRLQAQLGPLQELERDKSTITRRAAGIVRVDGQGARDDAGYVNVFRTSR